MDTIRKVGDSLAGRYFQFRLQPFDIKEVGTEIEPDDAMERILNVGGFPEPFLENEQEFYGRWKKTYPGSEEVRRVAYYLANLNLKD